MERRSVGRRRSAPTSLAISAILALGAASFGTSGAAQAQEWTSVRAGAVTANGEVERYLRVLQVAGSVDVHPWSARGFSPLEIDRLLDEAENLAPPSDGTLRPRAEGQGLRLIPPGAALIFNSTFPDLEVPGAVWAGRGATFVLDGGVQYRSGALSVVLHPTAFWAQNRGFPLMPTGGGTNEFADARFPAQIDLPQRFGDGSYSRVDPGQSTVRIDAAGAAVGISSANQQWGPAVRYPLVLGDNAAGFLHLFLGTSAPLDVGVGSLHGRLLWGALEQSALFDPGPSSRRRFMAGAVGVVTIRGVEGLEVGGARFFHDSWPENGFGSDQIFKVFEGFLKSRLRDTGEGPDGQSRPDNQLASIFARWVFPRSRLEVWGEFAREDHSRDLRDLVLEPDHDSGYSLGIQRLWPAHTGLLAIRAEIVNAQVTHLELGRPQVPFYIHSEQRQGHTHRGQILGAPAAYGGSGAALSVDYYHAGGRLTAFIERVLRRAREGDEGEADLSEDLDTVHRLGLEGHFLGARFDLTAGLTGAVNLNRNFGGDAFNLGARLGARARI